MSTETSSRGPLRRVLGLTAAIAIIVGLAFVVARPRADPDPVAVNLAAQKGPRPPGLKIFVQRGQALQILEPATELHPGDVLRLVVRASTPRYLVVRLRDAAGRERVVFPRDAPLAAPVRPGDTLPDPVVLDGAPGKTTLTARFGKQPFATSGRTADGDLEVATVDLRTAP